jgi:hypothetical protein
VNVSQQLLVVAIAEPTRDEVVGLTAWAHLVAASIDEQRVSDAEEPR